MAEWFLYTAHMQSFAFKKGLVSKWTSWPSVLKNIFMTYSEHSWYKLFKEILADRMEPPIEEALKEGEKDIPIYFEGETILTVGRARMFIKEGANMVVNCAPFTCMPGTICTALFQKIQTETGVPIVNMFYDGEGDLNSRLSVFVNNLAH